MSASAEFLMKFNLFLPMTEDCMVTHLKQHCNETLYLVLKLSLSTAVPVRRVTLVVQLNFA